MERAQVKERGRGNLEPFIIIKIILLFYNLYILGQVWSSPKKFVSWIIWPDIHPERSNSELKHYSALERTPTCDL